MGVLYSISIDYFKLSRENYARAFSTGLIIPAAICLLLFPVLFFFHAPLEKNFHFQPSFFWMVPSGLFLNFCFEAFIILMRNQNKVKLFTRVSILKVLVEIGLSVLLIVFIYKSWYSRALSILISGVVVGGMFFYHAIKNKFLVRSFNYKVFKNELYFGISGMLLQTAIFFINSSDKFFVMAWFGKEQAGYYAVAATFATIQYVVSISLLQYLQPVLYGKFSESFTWKQVKGLYQKYFLAMIATLAGVIVFTFIVYHYVLKAAYKEYLLYFYILCISAFVWSVSNIFLQFILFNKNKKIILQLSAISIFISFGVNSITARYFGIVGLSVGQIFTNIFVLFIVLYFNNKLKYFA